MACGLALLVGLAACSGERPPEVEAGGGEGGQKQRPEPVVCPLTGERPRGVNLDRPAVAVKIENSAEARPQSGLEKADLVYEEIVEGGITRFMAIYHCGEATKAGPVRSARFDDPKIGLPHTKVLAYSGANGIVEQELKRNGLIGINELNGRNALFRVPPGSTDTHSLYTDTKRVRALATDRGKPGTAQADFLEFGKPSGQAKPARSVTVTFRPNAPIEWRFKGGEWLRFEEGVPFESATGGQIAVDNLLVQEVEVNNSGTLVDTAGFASPKLTMTGGGRAFLFREGKVLKGEWRSKEKGRATVFETKSGDPFVFATGSTWVELLPSKKGEVKGSVDLS